MKHTVQFLAFLLLFAGGAPAFTSEFQRSWYLPDAENTPAQPQLQIRDGNLVVRTGRSKKVLSPAFPLKSSGKFSRPYRMRFRCSYRTEQYKGQGIGLNFVQFRPDGRRMGTLAPVIRVTGDHSCYLFNDTRVWKTIDVLVDFGNALPASLALEWSFFVPKGVLEMRDVKVDLIEQENHEITGGEFRINSNLLRHVFFADEGELRIRIADPEKNPQACLRILDEEGREISSEKIPLDGKIKLSGRGYRRGIVEALYPDGKRITTEFSAAVLGRSIDDALLRRSRYGLMVVNGTFQFARKLGARWDWRFFSMRNCRLDSTGNIIPPRKENVFHSFDATRVPIYAGGDNTPVPKALVKAENREKKGLYPPENWDLYRKMVESWAKAHPDMNGKYLCVVNEPNYRWYGTWKELAEAHRIFAEAVRKIHPETKVMGPACSRIEMDFMRQMGQHGLFDSMDGIVMHCYVDGTAPEGEFWEGQKEFFRYLKEIGKRDMPLHYTEFGWTTWEGTWQTPVDELTQARYLARSMALLSTERIDSIVYFCDFYNTRNRGESGFSILRRENDHLAPKPSVAAYMTMTRNLTGVIGETKLLQLTPEIWLVTGKRRGDFVQVVWHSSGKERISLPLRIDEAENFVGRKEPLQSSGGIAVSESPLYLFSRDSSLYEAERKPEIRAVPGDSIKVAAEPLFVPGAFRREGGMIRLPYDVMPGCYSLILRQGDVSVIRPVLVENAVELTGITPVWKGKNEPQIYFQVESRFEEERIGTLTCAGISKQVHLKKGRNDFILPLGEVRRVSGSVVCTVENPGRREERFRTARKFEHTFYPISRLPERGIRAVAPLPESEWKSPKEEKNLLAPSDCRPELRIAWGREGVYILAEVLDNEFAQPYQQERMWLGDSLQLAFDVDASKLWDANNLGFGFKGHRCFEFTVGLTGSGVQTYCHYAYDPVLKPGMANEVKAEVTRHNGKTIYSVLFSWHTIGLMEAPPPGTRFGFAAAVNDLDSGARKALCLFQGIVESKDPVRYGTLYLTE